LRGGGLKKRFTGRAAAASSHSRQQILRPPFQKKFGWQKQRRRTPKMQRKCSTKRKKDIDQGVRIGVGGEGERERGTPFL
jgi:hypothetical protein